MNNEIIDLISNVGFPIFISLYLLSRFENRIEKLDNSINNLCSTITNLEHKSY